MTIVTFYVLPHFTHNPDSKMGIMQSLNSVIYGSETEAEAERKREEEKKNNVVHRVSEKSLS